MLEELIKINDFYMTSDPSKPVFLPKTSFPMRLKNTRCEEEILDFWKHINIYKKLRHQSRGRKKFILHFGPPYANGPTHMGHALSEILKDILNRMMQMKGFDAPMVPGWDGHGLPIEQKVVEIFAKKGIKKNEIPAQQLIEECRIFAQQWVDVQQEEFMRMGINANWNHPYKTMDFKSEAAIAQQFSSLLLKGKLYRGKKPVFWSVVEQTALAEAEVEYEQRTSDAFFVSFPIVKNPISGVDLSGVEAVIWTTTPWSIPGNRAIAYGHDFGYIIIHITNTNHPLFNRKFLIAQELENDFCTHIDLTGEGAYHIVGRFPGSSLEGGGCHHPLHIHGYDFDVPFLPGEHVTIEAGTGLVHTAPDHGVEDFFLGKKFGLDLPSCVEGNGVYGPKVPLFAGQHIFKIAPEMSKALREVGALLKEYKITHSYPHSWRSKDAPLIFRCTTQWFLNLDAHHLRTQALQAINDVQWFPSQAKRRIQSMVEKRPDWCLSRQRVWGVPITVFLHKETGEPLKKKEVQEKIIQAIEKEGIVAWQRYDNAYFLKGHVDDPDRYEKVSDILDVWFDSASTHYFVLQQRPDLAWPADVYLEGSDQHRGWFQSSLLQSCATMGHAPYKKVITHGFVLDEKGHKMSKSVGNVMAPQDVIGKYGADLLRLWVAMTDYTQDVRIGPNIVKHQEDIFHRFRNTIRYLLGNLKDLQPHEETVDYDQLPSLDRYMLGLLSSIQEDFDTITDDYNFANFYSRLHYFCSQDLSAFYFDIRKDCLYCDDIHSKERISARYTMHQILVRLLKWLAPVLSFSAEEAWHIYLKEVLQKDIDHLPCAIEPSIHLCLVDPLPSVWKNDALHQEWKTIRSIRSVITGALEVERHKKTIGSSLLADIVVYLEKIKQQWLLDLDWGQISIVSHATIVNAPIPQEAFRLPDVPGVGVLVKLSNGHKCVRCWKVGCGGNRGPNHLCDRCYRVGTASML